MKSQTSQVARSCRTHEWAAMVQECRNRLSGRSVNEWCQANNITKANYYYHFAQVKIVVAQKWRGAMYYFC